MRGLRHPSVSFLFSSGCSSVKPHKSSFLLFLFTQSYLSCSSSLAELCEPNTAFTVNNTKAFESSQALRKTLSHRDPALRLRGKAVNFVNKERLRKYSSLLRNCAEKGSLSEGRLIHGHIIKIGLELDSHLWVSLINAYAKCGNILYAYRVFDLMPERDVASWTALISGFLAEGYNRDGLSLFAKMRSEGVRSNEFALATGLKACCMCLDLGFGKQLHVEAMKLGFASDIFVGSSLVDLYAKCHELEFANSVFQSMPEQNVVSWNVLLNGYAEICDGEKVMNLFCSLKVMEIKSSVFTLSTVLKGCANSGLMKAGQAMHSLAIRFGCVYNEFLGCVLVDMYSQFGWVDEAVKVFKRIKDPDVVAWSEIITCIRQQGDSQEAAELFKLMRYRGVKPNQFTFSSIVSAATDVGNLYFGESIHACICKYGFEYDSSVGNALISMYMQYGRLLDGTRVFGAMDDKDLVSWNALLSGLVDNENLGLSIFNEMLVRGFRPNKYTFDSVLRLCPSLLDVGFGKQVHACIVKENLVTDDFVGASLVDMYAKNGCLKDADLAFSRLAKKDIISWTTIISAYAQSDQVEMALKYFIRMLQEGVRANHFTLSSCISACSHMATLENGRLLHSMAVKAGHLFEMFISTALLDMYGKCGCIQDSEAIFRVLAFRDTISWNAMMGVYVQHGQGEKALEAFRKMLNEGLVPDEVTFIVILSACSRMGWIDEGEKHFSSMSNVYGMTPKIEHFACMIDIFGRAGDFKEVERIINEYKLTPNVKLWETILGACRMHGEFDFGLNIAEELLELEPDTDSNYILLSQIFAARGMWEEFGRVRALMTRQGVKKEPGCSWVEVNGQVHVFTSQDGSHPKSKDIYMKLDELQQELTLVGYMPKTEHVLHNITETEKVEYLYGHSERLAFAFALISINSSKTIRIFQNIRICGDCHDVMKLYSNVTNRQIVVRDINHFHHFKNGICSCQDIR